MANKLRISASSIVLVLASLVLSIIICNYKCEVWEEKARTFLYAVKRDSIPDYAKEIVDENGIPYVIYSEQNGIHPGKQYNPTIVANYAIKYYEQVKKSGDASAETNFKNCVDWLIKNITDKNSYALYQFNWRQPWYPAVGVPYTSGMTSARVIEVLTYAYERYKSPEYLAHAKQLMRGFFIPIEDGGFAYKTANGWWYEEIADAQLQTPRILDGHIFAVTGVHKYWTITKDDSARLIVQKGLQSLKERLHEYDAGNGWSYYDVYKKPSDKKYHRILTSQMKQLWDISGDSFFQSYYRKWNAYFERPYVVRAVRERNFTFMFLFGLCFLVTAGFLFFLKWIYRRYKHS